MPKNLYRSYIFIFLSLAGFYLLTQLEIVLRFYPSAPGPELLGLLYSQTENLLLAGGLAALFRLCYRRRRARRLYWGLLSLLWLYLTVNQLFYDTFADHLQFDFIELAGLSLARLSDSLLSQLGPLFYLNLLLAGLLSAWLYRQLAPPQRAAVSPWQAELAAHPKFYGLLALALLAFGWFNANPQRNFSHHPLVTLAASLFRAETALADYPYNPHLDLDSPRYGRPAFDPQTEAGLLAYAQRRRQTFEVRSAKSSKVSRPNLIYFILESVGSANLLPEGRPDPAVTPNLHRLLPQAIIFPNLTNTFPGSERSHIPLNSGGITYTWGGGFKGQRYRYTGPTLAGELRRAGYQTGLFSAAFMDTENFFEVYDDQPFDARLIPELEPPAYQQQHRLNSWGLDETEVLRRATGWLETTESNGPFFLLFLTSASHHPYTVPAGYPAPFPADSDLNRYRNTLHFTDALIGQLVDHLRQTGQLTNTVIAISGDHGQAFGERHPGNFLHKNRLYQENIQNFLLLLDFSQQDGPIASAKTGFIGDVMPTLLSLAGAAPPDTPGQNLFSPDYQARIHYFHKNARPEQWGLLDWPWKFITGKNGNANPELYNLAADPTEQRNLAAAYPDKVDAYHFLAAQWYIRADRQFAARLADPANLSEALTDLAAVTRPGPTLLRFGLKPDAGEFQSLEAIPPDAPLVAWTAGVAYPRDTTLRYEWRSPDGVLYPQAVTYQAGWSAVWTPPPLDPPLTEGRWRLRILDETNRLLLQGAFLVAEGE
jgi:phosphoglycerol transferase MdoB-like AlkP superfamily enzyme